MRAATGGLLLAALFLLGSISFLLMPVGWVDQLTVRGTGVDLPGSVWRSRNAPRARDRLPSITAHELCAALDEQPRPTVIDVRSPEKFRLGHVPGARRLAGARLRAASSTIPGDRMIVVYDDWPGGYYAAQARGIVRDDERLDVRLLDGGYTAWAESSCAVG